MSKYTHHSLALNNDEQAQFEEVKRSTGFGVKKIFMAMIKALKPAEPTVQQTATPIVTEEE